MKIRYKKNEIRFNTKLGTGLNRVKMQAEFEEETSWRIQTNG